MGLNRLRFERSVACPFSAAIEHAESYFRTMTPRLLRVPLRMGPFKLQLKRAIATEVLIAPDETDPARKHEALEVWIRPLGRMPFPELRSRVTVRPQLPPGARLVLDLAYEPPLGLPGRVLDVLAGRRVARAIGNALLADIARHLTARAV